MRSAFLRRLADEVPGSNVRLMPQGDRHAYFDMSKKDQLREWCGHKTSVVVNRPHVPGQCADGHRRLSVSWILILSHVTGKKHPKLPRFSTLFKGLARDPK